jgi:hypothetical protein
MNVPVKLYKRECCKRREDEVARMRARINFVINTSHRHTEPVPEWVVRTLRGENPSAELP